MLTHRRTLRPWRNMGFRIAVLAITFTLIAAVISGFKPHLRADVDPFLLSMGALWYLGVPLWFCIEWAMFRPTAAYGKEDFQYSQSLARNFWIAAAAVLAFLIGIDLSGTSKECAAAGETTRVPRRVERYASPPAVKCHCDEAGDADGRCS